MTNERILAAVMLLAAALALDARAGSAGQAANPAASTPSQPSAQSQTFNKDEIAQVVAPIALYPDSLLAQVLMASTYPGDVADAAKWAKDHPDMKGDAAVKAVAKQPWDASVQALVAFPAAILMMGQDIAWVQKLGDAFLAQPNDVMAMAQELRRKAQSAGNLKTNEYQTVSTEAAGATSNGAQTIVIEPAQTQTVYVPTYDPNTIYGTWGYPYPPYYYPPAAYYPGYAFGSGLFWGVGIGISIGMWGDCDWGGGDININSQRFNEFNRNIDRGDRQIGDRTGRDGTRGGNQKWQHDGARRDGVPYRDQASREKYGNRQAGGESRDRFRGEDAGRSQSRAQARQQMERQGFEPARDNQQARDRAQTASRDPRSAQAGGGRVDRGPGGSATPYRQSGASNAGSRDLARSSGGGGSYGQSRNNAFSGASNSGASRAASNRGRSSGSSMSRGGYSGGGRSMSRPSRGGGGGGRRR